MLDVDDRGSAPTWGDHVNDEEYGAARAYQMSTAAHQITAMRQGGRWNTSG
jgi:hypothetical protein